MQASLQHILYKITTIELFPLNLSQAKGGGRGGGVEKEEREADIMNLNRPSGHGSIPNFI